MFFKFLSKQEVQAHLRLSKPSVFTARWLLTGYKELFPLSCTQKNGLINEENLPVVVVWEVGSKTEMCLLHTSTSHFPQCVSDLYLSKKHFLVFFLFTVDTPSMRCQSKTTVVFVCQVVEHCWWSVS